jgi:hypothetical protein
MTAARGVAAGPAARHPAARRAAAALTVLTLLLTAGLVPLSIAAHQLTFTGFWGQILIVLPMLAVGAVVARRQPANPLGWFFLVLMVLFAAGLDAGMYAVLAYRLGHHLPFGPVALVLALSWAPTIVTFPAAIVLFPDGRLPSTRWRWVIGAYAVVGACWPLSIYAVAIGAIAGHNTQVVSGGDLRAVDFPAGASAWLGTVESVLLPALAVFWLIFTARQVMSWRSADGERRQQLKWLMAGTAVTIASTAIVAVGSTLDTSPSPLAVAVFAVANAGIVALPICVGVAIMKYRLYEIDRIISRTLAYAIVTGLLVGVYAGLVLLATHVLGFTGSVSVAASTLAAAALFTPLRHWVQRAVDRKFNRARYDADRTVAAFAAGLQGSVDLDTVRGDLAAAVQAALEPAHVSVWLAQPSRRPQAPEATSR